MRAVQSGEAVIPVFILDNTLPWARGGASQWWLHQNLQSLDESLQTKGTHLIYQQGKTIEILKQLLESHPDITAIYCNRRYEPAERQLETQLQDALGERFKTFMGNLLYEPNLIANKNGKPFSSIHTVLETLSSPFFTAEAFAGNINATHP